MPAYSRSQPLDSRIRQILHEYPCGDTIIFELVQNADDAGAQSAKIVIDPGSSISLEGAADANFSKRDETLGWTPCMTSAANPALYFYNSGVFTDSDLNNLKYIGGDDSTSKRHDATKVGRFGIGFNSTFHLSDVVVLVSDCHFVALDPACAHLPRLHDSPVDGIRCNFLTFENDPDVTAKERDFVRHLLDRLEESGLGFNRKEAFKGTIFRLALRQRASDFWSVVHPVDDVQQLISDFFYSGRVSLVLMKNVASIDAHVITRDTDDSVTLQRYYSLKAEWSDDAIATRTSLVKWLTSYTSAVQQIMQDTRAEKVLSTDTYLASLPDPLALSFDVDIDYTTAPSFAFAKDMPSVDREGSIAMHVNHQLGPGTGWDGSKVWPLADQAARYRHPLFVPWAAAISEGGARVNGRTLCFFPIQGHSQLPVHVHGYFKLSSDRQSIINCEHNEWNKALSTEVVSYAFASCVQARCAANRPSYGLWPTASYTDSTIRAIADATIDLLADMKCIVTSGGRLAKPADALFVSDESLKVHEHLASIAPDVATCADLDAEGLGALTAVADALGRRREGAVHYADPADYRRLVAASTAEDMVEDVGVAIGLLYRCAADGDVAAVAAMGLNNAVPLLPMEDGSVRPWNDDAARGPPLLLAKTKAEHDLLALLPGAAGRLVRWLDAAEPDDAVVLSSAVAEGSSLTLSMCVAVHVLLEKLEPLQSVVKFGTPERIVDAIAQSLSPTSFYRARREADTFTGYDLVMPSSVDGDADVCVPATQLFAVLIDLRCDSKFALPLLPVVALDPSCTAGAEHLDRIRAVSCRWPNVVVSTTLAQGNSTDAPLGRVLTALGALWVRAHHIVPSEMLAEWKLPPSGGRTAKVFRLDAKRRDSVEALSACLNDTADIEATIRGIIGSDSLVAAVILSYLAGVTPHLTSEDLKLVRKLPVFPDHHGQLVSLSGAQPHDPIALPQESVPGVLAAALKRGRPSHCSQLQALTILRTAPAEQRPLFQDLGIRDVPLHVLELIAAPCLPVPGSPTFDSSCNEAWQSVMATVASSRTFSALEQIAIQDLKQHAFVPSAANPSAVVTCDRCITPRSLECHPHVRDFLLLPQIPDALPRIASCCFVGGDASLAQRALVRLGACDRLSAREVVEIIKAFSQLAHSLDDQGQLRRFSAGLLLLLEQYAGSLPAADWSALRSEEFVPVQQSAGSSVELRRPSECLFPDKHALNPNSAKSCIAMKVVADGRCPGDVQPSLGRCGQHFGWDALPTLGAMVQFLNWTLPDDSVDGRVSKAVREKAVSMDSVYAAIELALSRQQGALPELQDVSCFYFAGEGISVETRFLARDEAGRQLEPYLRIIDPTVLRKYPKFFDAIGIPRTHAPDQIASVTATLAAHGQLTDEQRSMLAKLLEYLVKVSSTPDQLVGLADRIFVPTTDGRAALARDVMYDYFDLSEQTPKNDLLHACVSSHVARGLRMKHSGERHLERLRSSMSLKGQKVALDETIGRVLNDYSDHQAVLLEMLQNADDAGATTVDFYLDTRTFKTEREGLLGEGMAACQGAALVVRNDAKFSPGDFEAILNLGRSSKADDAMKIGRFGVGFNTVYHVTDCPSLVSGTNALFFDPTVAHIDGISADNPGMMIDFREDASLATDFPHQFEPYTHYGADMGSSFEGTLFRLPLRTKASSLSQTLWLQQNVRDMFQDFAPLLKTAMLFLKSVVSIRLHEVDTAGTDTPLYSAKFDNADDIRAYRATMRERMPKSMSLSCRMRVVVSSHRKSDAIHDFHVTSRVKSPGSMPPDLRSIVPPKLQAKLVQWASVAVDVEASEDKCSIAGGNGSLACFLPLPCRINMPFWLHGYFTLSSDRRSLAVEGFGEGSAGTWEMKWNAHVLRIGAECLAESLHSLAAMAQDANVQMNLPSFYNLWPLPSHSSPHVKAMASPFFDYVVSQKRAIFWSTRRQPFAVSSTRFLGEQTPPALTTVFHDLFNDCKALVQVHSSIQEQTLSAAARCEIATPEVVSPQLAVEALKRRRAVATHAQEARLLLKDVLPTIADHDDAASLVAALVTYVVKEVNFEPALRGVPLLLLDTHVDHGVCLGVVDSTRRNVFMPANDPNAVHMKNIFPGFAGFIEPEFWKKIPMYFGSGGGFAALSGWAAHGVMSLSVKDLGTCFERGMLPHPSLARGQAQAWYGPADDPVLARWLRHVWTFLVSVKGNGTLFHDDMAVLGQWPLVPSRRNGEHSIALLQDAAALLHGSADPAVQAILAAIGVSLLDSDFECFRDVARLCKVPALEACAVADKVFEAQQRGLLDTSVSQEHRAGLLKYFERHFYGEAGKTLNAKVKTLHLFEVVGRDGAWTWGPVSSADGAHALAVPDGLPVTRVCHGMYRAPMEAFGVLQCSVTEFFAKVFFPCYDRDGGISALITVAEEMDYWRVFAKAAVKGKEGAEATDAEVLAPFKSRQVVPIPTSVVESLEDQKALALLRDGVRAAPEACAQPMLIKGAPLPSAVSVLMRYAPNDEVRIVPDVLWRDDDLKKLLARSGVNETSACACIVAAANMLQRLIEGPAGERHTLLHDLSASGDQPAPETDTENEAETEAKHLRDLGVSLCLAAAQFGGRDAIRKLSNIKFLLPEPEFEVHGRTLHQLHAHPCEPCGMARHKDAALIFSQPRPVGHPLLDDEGLLAGLIPPLQNEDVVKHLVEFGTDLSESGPQRRLGTEDSIDTTLVDIYRFLIPPPFDRPSTDIMKNTECRTLLLENPVFAVPRGVFSRFREWASDNVAAHAIGIDEEMLDCSAVPEMCRRLVPFAWVGLLRTTATSGAPFWYSPRDFDQATSDFLGVFPMLKPPSPTDTVRRVRWAAQMIAGAPDGQAAPTALRDAYVNLLDVLVSAARGRRWRLPQLVDDAPLDGAAMSAEELAEVRELRKELLDLPILLDDGTFAPLPTATTGDNPGLLRRCDRSKLRLVDESTIKRDLCRQLGVPSMLRVLKEVPGHPQPLPRTPTIDAWNTMLRSAEFQQAVIRILETEKFLGDVVARSNSGWETLTTPAVKAHFDALKCERVSSIVATIVDERSPSVDLAAGTSTEGSARRSAFEAATSTICLVMRDTTDGGAPDTAVERRNLPFLLAKEVNVALNGAIANVAPLAAVCSMVEDLGADGISEISSVIDSFECIDVASPTPADSATNAAPHPTPVIGAVGTTHPPHRATPKPAHLPGDHTQRSSGGPSTLAVTKSAAGFKSAFAKYADPTSEGLPVLRQAPQAAPAPAAPTRSAFAKKSAPKKAPTAAHPTKRAAPAPGSAFGQAPTVAAGPSMSAFSATPPQVAASSDDSTGPHANSPPPHDATTGRGIDSPAPTAEEGNGAE